MPAKSDPRDDEIERAGSQFYVRRPLATRELLPAIAVGIGAGLFAYYVTKVLTQRVPLRPGAKVVRRPSPLPRPTGG
jgi:hypothetical protein